MNRAEAEGLLRRMQNELMRAKDVLAGWEHVYSEARRVLPVQELDDIRFVTYCRRNTVTTLQTRIDYLTAQLAKHKKPS